MKKLTLILITFSLATYVLAYSGGNGTISNPYWILLDRDLEELMQTPSDWNKHFIQLKSIDCSGINIASIGNKTTYFSGTYIGNGNDILNLTYHKPYNDCLGLFGYIDSTGEVSLINLVNANVLGRSHIACFCGNNKGKITDCTVENGIANGKNNLGGFVGYNTGTITSCYCQCTIESATTGQHASRYGGFVGCNANGNIHACSSKANVVCLGGENAGGFCGLNYQNSVIENSQCKGTIETKSYSGGFCGNNKESKIQHCHSSTNICANSYSGGFVGINDSSSVISNSSASGNTIIDMNNSMAGGFVGLNRDAELVNCIASGDVSGDNNIGGFIGASVSGNVRNCTAYGNFSGNSKTGPFIGFYKHNYQETNSRGLGTLISPINCPN